MMLKNAAQAGATWARAMIFKQHVPLFASWNLTFRCTRACSFCGVDQVKTRELGTSEVLCGIRSLYSLGARFITFSGGEPLLREDLGLFLREAKKMGMTTFLSANGDLVPDRIEDVKIADRITLSLDGPASVHDRIRGQGSFDAVERAIGACREYGVSTALQCTLCEHNLAHVDEILSISKGRGLNVMFQPATENLDSFALPNPIAPDPASHRRAVEQLIRRKREGAPVANSLAGLAHLANWPEPAPILCGAGRYFVCIEPDGSLLSCHQAQTSLLESNKEENRAGTEADLASRFSGLQIPRNCRECWCAPLVELAMIFSLSPEAVGNAMRTVKC